MYMYGRPGLAWRGLLGELGEDAGWDCPLCLVLAAAAAGLGLQQQPAKARLVRQWDAGAGASNYQSCHQSGLYLCTAALCPDSTHI